MRKCERQESCKDCKLVDGVCIHYENNDGDPCDHEASYWEEFKTPIIDEKHRFPIYNKGDEVYHINLYETPFSSRSNIVRLLYEIVEDRLKNVITKVTLYSDAVSDRFGWCYEDKEEYTLTQHELFETYDEALEYLIKYIEYDYSYHLVAIEKLKKLCAK